MESMSCQALILGLWCLIVFAEQGSALKCAICNSVQDKNCATVPPPPTECPANYAKPWCLELWEKDAKGNVKTYTRTCVEHFAGNDCQSGHDATSREKTTLCQKSCREDNCNHASATSALSWATVIALALSTPCCCSLGCDKLSAILY